jgi:hypothetical protein
MKRLGTVMLCILVTVCALWGRQINPGKERWVVKTSVKAGVAKTGTIAYAAFAPLPDANGVKHNDSRFDDKLIPASMTPDQPAEGTIVTVTGFLRLVALEDDGDYHIQLTATPTDTDCIIVEVPKDDPEFVKNAALRDKAAAVRVFVRKNLLHKEDQEPSQRGNLMTHPPFVRVTGQLFFDDAHVGDPKRGKQNMKASTLWEIHPVTAMAFAPVPGGGKKIAALTPTN